MSTPPPNGLQLSHASAITHQVQLTVPALGSSGYGSVPPSPAPASNTATSTTSSPTPLVQFGQQHQHRPPFVAPQSSLQQQQQLSPTKPKRIRPPKRKAPPQPPPPPPPPLIIQSQQMSIAPIVNNVNMPTMSTAIVNKSRPKLSAAAMKQRQEDEIYSKKMYFLKRTIKALVFKNAALCDEVARLNQRIYTVSEERKMLVKRMQHHERNRLRKLLIQQKKFNSKADMNSPIVVTTSDVTLSTGEPIYV